MQDEPMRIGSGSARVFLPSAWSDRRNSVFHAAMACRSVGQVLAMLSHRCGFARSGASPPLPEPSNQSPADSDIRHPDLSGPRLTAQLKIPDLGRDKSDGFISTNRQTIGR